MRSLAARRSRVPALGLLVLLAACASDAELDSVEPSLTALSLSNAGFESDFAGWTQVEPAAISSVAHGGARSAKLSRSTGRVRRTVGGLAPSTSYALSAWVQGTARIGVRNHGAPEVAVKKTASTWARVTVSFTTGPGATSAEIFAAWASGGDARVDDFVLAGPDAPAPAPSAADITPGAGAVTASGSDLNLPVNAVDDDLATRWSASGDGAWLQLDLGAATLVSFVKVAVYNGASRSNRFDVLLSSDGASWTTAWSGASSGTTTQLETYDFPDRTARYVRYVGHGYVSGTTVGSWSSVTEMAVFGTPPAPGSEPPPPIADPAPGCTYPAQLLDLAGWKVTLPVGAEESPTEIKQPALATYVLDPWFVPTSTCSGVRFRAPTSGVTTSGSGYPRSELREMTGDGSSNASWSTTSGTHRMFIDQAITALPSGKRHVVAGQIHDSGDDVIVIRLEGEKLFVDLNGTDGVTLDPSYTPGKRFTVELVAGGGVIKVFYNGASTPAQTVSRSRTGCYFKAGAYTQSNCSTEADAGSSCGPGNYGEVEIYDLRVRHE
jgi:hypothetical protein